MKRIYIKGNFTIQGDIPSLDMVQQPMSEAYIEVEDRNFIRLMQFKCPNDFMASAISLCSKCNCMTKTINGKCGKCKADKPSP